MACIASGCQQSDEPKEALSKPKPTYLAKDIGVVRTGTKHEVEFEIENLSDLDWTLRDISKSCRCVVADPLPKLILKQSSAKIRLTIEAGDESGDYDRMIRLDYVNRPGQLILMAKTRMRAPLYVTCRELHLPPSTSSGVIQAAARVENWSDENWSDLEVTPSVDWIKVALSPGVVPTIPSEQLGLRMRQAWEITVTAEPPGHVFGPIIQSVVIRAEGTDLVKTVPVAGVRPHPVSAQPPALIVKRANPLANSSDGQTLLAKLIMPSTSSRQSFQVLSATGTLPDGCVVSWEQVSETETRLEVLIPTQVSGGVNGRVVVRFADGLPDLVVPVVGGV